MSYEGDLNFVKVFIDFQVILPYIITIIELYCF